MNGQEVAKTVIKLSGKTLGEIASACGKPNAANIGMFLQSKSMRVESLQMILNACGYELVARSNDGTRPEYIIGEDSVKQEQPGYNEDNLRQLVKSIVEEELKQFHETDANGQEETDCF